MNRILLTWLPLAASWALMAVELPALTIVVNRLADPEINIAAYWAIVFQLALLIEAPIIMLLAASTALCKDMASYKLVRRFMMVAGGSLTALHVLVAFTPLYYVVAVDILGADPKIIEPARIGLMIMTPWTWAIAYRRFNQGVLIRFGYSHTVTIGTVIRLTADVLVLTVGYLVGSIPGIVVATSAVAAGVTSEAVYSGIAVRPVVRNDLPRAETVIPVLTWKAFFNFYIPLALTSLIFLLANPIGSAAINRMPRDIASQAAFAVLGAFIFILRSIGMAFNEVVIALIDRVNSYFNLRKFTSILAASTTFILLLLAASPLSTFYFERIMAQPAELSALAKSAVWLALPLPALTVFQSWFQGVIVHGKKTRGVTESVVVYLVTSAFVLLASVLWGGVEGIYIAVLAMSIGMTAQVAWLWFRSRPVLREVKMRDTTVQSPAAA